MQAISFARNMPRVSYLIPGYALNGHRQLFIGRLCIKLRDMNDEDKLRKDSFRAGCDSALIHQNRAYRQDYEECTNDSLHYHHSMIVAHGPRSAMMIFQRVTMLIAMVRLHLKTI